MSWHRPNAPDGRITSPFGPRGQIANAPNASTNHLGVDLRAGTLGVTSDIYAATAGKVRRIYKTPLNAWVLELDHGSGVWTRYAHMQRASITVAAGDRVAGGQRIAAASNSGAPTVHLHFEVLVNGHQTDPVPYLQARGVDLTVTTTAAARPGASGQVAKPTTPGAPAPITPIQEDDMRGLIEALYRRYHGREGSTREVDDWVISAAQSGKTPKQIVAAFESGHAETGTVVAAYNEILSRGPSTTDITAWLKDRPTVKQVRDGIAGSAEAKGR
ncbi:M23 family metallopeptidase [Oerskovia paurometabola]|uniref:M23 family metallopeptidase n=1 Tax=Oerskovia paurometabola TaxID=162170 RepID=UPI00343E7868